MTAHRCTTCTTTTDVWTCKAGTFCRLHLPEDAGVLWRHGVVR